MPDQPAALAVGRLGEPWRPGKRASEIVADTYASGARADEEPNTTGHGHVDYYGGILVAESMEPSRRDRAIACVNALAGVEIPADAPAGWLAQRLAELERVATRPAHTIGDLLWDYLADWFDSDNPVLLWPMREGEYAPRIGRHKLWGKEIEVLHVWPGEHPYGAVLADARERGSESFLADLRRTEQAERPAAGPPAPARAADGAP